MKEKNYICKETYLQWFSQVAETVEPRDDMKRREGERTDVVQLKKLVTKIGYDNEFVTFSRIVTAEDVLNVRWLLLQVY